MDTDSKMATRAQIEQRTTDSGGAIFDRSGKYRYLLWRSLGKGCGNLVFVMLNPNKADEIQDDPTIRRCASFAKDWGFSRLEVVNLFALKAREPKDLIRSRQPVGPLNDSYLIESMDGAGMIVAAWGNYGGHLERSTAVLDLAASRGHRLKCLALNACGEPRHPLYMPASAKPLDFLR
ncbi:MAG: DUF1643 domain-containing protein [Candidatus Obscuribacterales bacterium]|nr:DUF1643 domain-containing protein [Candidatus Obscuribacterales bacterium]